MLEVETAAAAVYEELADKTIKYIHAAKDEKSRRVRESRTVCAEEEEGEALGAHNRLRSEPLK